MQDKQCTNNLEKHLIRIKVCDSNRQEIKPSNFEIMESSAEGSSGEGKGIENNMFMKQAKFRIAKIEKIGKKIEEQKAFESLTKFEILEWKNALTTYEAKWDKAVKEIICIDEMPRTQKAYFEAQIASIEDRCIGIKAKMLQRLEQLEKQIHPEANELQACVQPEKEPEPYIENTWGKFSGAYNEWPRFKKEFEDKIGENQKLSNETKLEALKEAYDDEEMFREQPGSKYFPTVWANMVKRFENRYRQIISTLDELMEMPTVNVCCSSEMIRKEIKKMQGWINSIKMLTETDPSTIITGMAIVRMNTGTASAWDRVVRETLNDQALIEKGEYIPSWIGLKGFLEHQAELNEQEANAHGANTGNIGEQMDNRSVLGDESRNIPNVVDEAGMATPLHMSDAKQKVAKYLQCVCCDGIHPIYRCGTFLRLPLHIKKMHITDLKLCDRCLREEHDGQCKDPKQNNPCPGCLPDRQYHNSSMCPKKHKSEFRERPGPSKKWQPDEEWADC